MRKRALKAVLVTLFSLMKIPKKFLFDLLINTVSYCFGFCQTCEAIPSSLGNRTYCTCMTFYRGFLFKELEVSS